MTKRRNWADLSARSKRLIIVGATVQVGLLTAALTDISRRPEEMLRGPRAMWVALSFINFVGPITYFAAGRKRT
jgi:Phospholipase_D-nuclease N-terminal